MDVRDAVEADAERMADLGDAPADVMRNLVHDRTVRIAAEGADDEKLLGFVSYDARRDTVHVTQLEGNKDSCELLLAEPKRFAEREGMAVELLAAEDDETLRDVAEAAGFEEDGPGPRFGGTPTVRYRLAP